MAKIFPFRGVYYNLSKINSLKDVITEPYDKIDEKLQKIYYERHPYNFVRIILGIKEPDTPTDNVYTRSAKFLEDWLKKEILITSKEECLFAYYQTFKIGNRKFTRKGFSALVELQEPGTGVKAHEKTLSAPKEDRLNLMRTTYSNTEHIFMLYDEPEMEINNLLDEEIQKRKPDLETDFDDNTLQQMWFINNKNLIKRVQKIIEPLDLFIADGHHRYETAINFWKEMETKNVKCDGNESIKNCLVTLVNMNDPGLVILPTHRLIHSVQNFNFEDFLNKIKEDFYVEEIDFNFFGGEKGAIAELEKLMDLRKDKEHLFGVYKTGINKIYLLSLKSENSMDFLKDKFSADWRKLDVSILHSLILEKILGIDEIAQREHRNLRYYRYVDEAIQEFKSKDKYQILFILNPTKPSQVKTVASKQERMPQKSTDFFPKILSGLVFNRMRIFNITI